MSLEESFALHEQWLQSLDSSHARHVEDLDGMRERQKVFEAAMSQYLTSITMNLAALAESQARADTRHEQIEEEHRKLVQTVEKLSEKVDRLSDLVESYIRAQNNGDSRN